MQFQRMQYLFLCLFDKLYKIFQAVYKRKGFIAFMLYYPFAKCLRSEIELGSCRHFFKKKASNFIAKFEEKKRAMTLKIYYCSSCVYVTPFFFDKVHNALFPEQCNITNEIDNLKFNFQVHWNYSCVSWIINEILHLLDYMLEEELTL